MHVHLLWLSQRGGRRAQGEGADGWAARRLVVAEGLVGALESTLGVQLRVLGALTGGQLAGCRYRHPLLEREAPVVVGGDYITTDSGTGLVHTAPGHGQEDYQARSLLCMAVLFCIRPCHSAYRAFGCGGR